jgi:hypothetical protein
METVLPGKAGLKRPWLRAAFGSWSTVDAHATRRRADEPKNRAVRNATVYRLCESGGLPHLRAVNSIRIRPKDLAQYVTGGPRSEKVAGFARSLSQSPTGGRRVAQGDTAY